ncbi:M67 family metallopeptidase [Novosphingobium barchaimii]|uniref:M67 family metallopeptidase n=1 Tax=Novosphingobium barchaimii TaxID=1420591 RepID=UPI001F399BE7|nr:M67 family metallopeptidase [Novosphingobium barchaimii]
MTSGVMAALRAEAKKAGDDECCGLLLGRIEGDGTERIEIAEAAANVAVNRRIHFEIDPLALLSAHKAARSGGLRLLGYYHSHPTGDSIPSATDCEHSTGDSRIWAIIARSEVAFWRDSGNGFVPLAPRAAD